MEKQSMKHLKLERNILPKSDMFKDMLNTQEYFNETFFNAPALDVKTRVRWTKETVSFLIDECSELREWMQLKHWKTYNQKVEENSEEIKFEIADMMAFMLTIVSLWFGSAEDFCLYYKTKMKENQDRQERGY